VHKRGTPLSPRRLAGVWQLRRWMTAGMNPA